MEKGNACKEFWLMSGAAPPHGVRSTCMGPPERGVPLPLDLEDDDGMDIGPVPISPRIERGLGDVWWLPCSKGLGALLIRDMA